MNPETIEIATNVFLIVFAFVAGIAAPIGLFALCAEIVSRTFRKLEGDEDDD